MLAIDALRWITCRALAGRTWAGDRIFDSPATVADLRIEAERQPFCAVYCDEADSEGVEQPTLTSPMNVRLVIETGIASAITPPSAAEGPGPPVSPVVFLNDTNPALEATIGFLSQQARDALLEELGLLAMGRPLARDDWRPNSKSGMRSRRADG